MGPAKPIPFAFSDLFNTVNELSSVDTKRALALPKVKQAADGSSRLKIYLALPFLLIACTSVAKRLLDLLR